mgnify:CR=1 FL=1
MRLIETGCEYVLVTGTHENTPQVVNTLYAKSGVVRTDSWPRLPGTLPRLRLHARVGHRRHARQRPRPADAVREAQDYTWHTLQKAYRPGMGQYLPDRLFWAREEAEARSGCVRACARRRRARQPLSVPPAADERNRKRLRAGPGSCGVCTPSRPTSSTSRSLVGKVEAAIAGGAQAIQYRNKSAPLALRRKQAAMLARCAAAAGALLIVNDDV